MKNAFKNAHEITKKIIRKGDSYRATFRLALIFVYSEIKKGVNKLAELKGSEKQVKWANDIRNKIVETCKKYDLPRVMLHIRNRTESTYYINNFRSNTVEKTLDLEILKIKSACGVYTGGCNSYWFKDFPNEFEKVEELNEIIDEF